MRLSLYTANICPDRIAARSHLLLPSGTVALSSQSPGSYVRYLILCYTKLKILAKFVDVPSKVCMP